MSARPAARPRSLLPWLTMAFLCLGVMLPRDARGDASLGGWMAQSPDDLTGFTTLAGNDNIVTVALPFTFTIEGTGYTNVAISTRIARVHLMEEPASIDANEITDRGYVNQRATLERRADLVERLFADPPATDVIVC